MWHSGIILITIHFFLEFIKVESCNEAVCGSVVSKCLLTQSCKCDLTNCTCCKDCFNCLSYLYSECCSCVDMCPKPEEGGNKLSKQSYVEDFNEVVPALFRALTEVPDTQDRWNSTTFPVDIDTTQYAPKKEIKIQMQSAEQEIVPIKPNIITLNCTVAFMSQCMGLNKCKSKCRSMGANSYRWFHDGCCECIGENCINYGINESRCKSCPYKGEGEEEPFDSSDYEDYGQDENLDEEEG